MTRDRSIYYVNEGYARRLASRKFAGGVVLGALIMWTWCEYRDLRKEYEKKKSKKEEIEFSDEDFA